MYKLFPRESLRDLGLALFIVGAFYGSVPSVNGTLSEVPWEHMPAATLSASAAFYNVNFIPLAEQYLAFVDGVGEVQAGAYGTLGIGVSAAATALRDTGPVAAVARWYIDASDRVGARLTPQ